jgi:hypothetical protein
LIEAQNGTGLSAETGFLLAGFANANILYAQTGRSFGCNSDEHLLLKSTDGGANWTAAWDWFTGLQLSVWALAIDPARPATLVRRISPRWSTEKPVL